MEWGGVNSREPLLARSIEPQPLFYRFVKVSTLTFSFLFFPRSYIRASWSDLDALDLRCSSVRQPLALYAGKGRSASHIRQHYTQHTGMLILGLPGKSPDYVHGGKPPSVRKTWIRAWKTLYVSEDTSLTFEPISSRPWGAHFKAPFTAC